MSVSETVVPFPVPKASPEQAFFKVSPQENPPKRVPVLDMGEASREEGFRLNGCR